MLDHQLFNLLEGISDTRFTVTNNASFVSGIRPQGNCLATLRRKSPQELSASPASTRNFAEITDVPREDINEPLSNTSYCSKIRKGMLGRATELETLVKHADFRIVLIVLKPETRLHEHKAAGRISVQTVACPMRMYEASQLFVLPAGHSLALEHVLPHHVEPSESSAFLLTICLSDDVEKS